MGELFTDYVRAWRITNLARIAEKLEHRLRKRGLAPTLKPLPTGVGLVLVEAASREDDEDLRGLWANLLANHSDPNREIELDKDVIEVIRQLTSVDARLITFLGEQTWDIHGVLAGGSDTARLADALGLRPPRVARSINSLWRLGCLLQEQAGPQMLDGLGLRVVGPTSQSNVSYRPSPLGEAILKAVAP